MRPRWEDDDDDLDGSLVGVLAGAAETVETWYTVETAPSVPVVTAFEVIVDAAASVVWVEVNVVVDGALDEAGVLELALDGLVSLVEGGAWVDNCVVGDAVNTISSSSYLVYCPMHLQEEGAGVDEGVGVSDVAAPPEVGAVTVEMNATWLPCGKGKKSVSS